jgi:hypothetical protein
MKRLTGYFCIAVVLTGITATTVLAETKVAARVERVERDFGNDRFAAGNSLQVDKSVAGDLIAAGGSVDVIATVEGDAVLVGGTVAVSKRIGQNFYAAAGRLFINDVVGRNARVTGGQVTFSQVSEVVGNVSAAGGEVTLNGKVKGHVLVAGGRVLIDAIVGGDVEATGGQVELGPNARIAGKLRYASREPLKRDPAAQVQGAVETFAPPGGWPVPENVEHGMGRAGGWIWTIGLMLLAAVLVALLPNFYAGVANSLRAHAGKSLLVGFITLVCVPVAALLFLITIIGVPLGLLTILTYLLLLVVGYVSTGISIGDWALQRAKSDASQGMLWRIFSAIMGVLVVSLLARIPWLGGWVVLLALLVGLGALALQIWQLREPKPSAT